MKVIYIRTSTIEQTPELQLRDIKTISGEDCEIFSEQQSAWKNDKVRPEFEKILSLIKKGKISDLYVFDLDRLYRNRKKLQELFILCKAYKTKIHSFRQKWLEDLNNVPQPWGEIVNDLMINIFGYLSEEESSKKSARVKMAIVRSDKGTFSHDGNKWGRKSLGSDITNRILELHNQGHSTRSIASMIHNNGKTISKGKVWNVINNK